MKRQWLYFAIVIVLAISPRISMGADSILGEWISVERTKGGMGVAKTYTKDGGVQVIFGALVDFKYKLNGNKLTLSFRDEANIVQNFEIKDSKLILMDDSGNKQELTRISGDPKYGIIGKWSGDHYTGQKQFLHFTTQKNCYLSVPMQFSSGSYQIKNNILIETYQGKCNQDWKVSIKNDILLLTSFDQGKTEKYMRKK